MCLAGVEVVLRLATGRESVAIFAVWVIGAGVATGTLSLVCLPLNLLLQFYPLLWRLVPAGWAFGSPTER